MSTHHEREDPAASYYGRRFIEIAQDLAEQRRVLAGDNEALNTILLGLEQETLRHMRSSLQEGLFAAFEAEAVLRRTRQPEVPRQRQPRFGWPLRLRRRSRPRTPRVVPGAVVPDEPATANETGAAADSEALNEPS